MQKVFAIYEKKSEIGIKVIYISAWKILIIESFLMTFS